jgi:hypothetical protein
MADDVVHGRCDTGCEAMDELAAAAAVFAMDIDPDAIEEVELEETYGAPAADFDQCAVSETSSEDNANTTGDAAGRGVGDASPQVSNSPSAPQNSPCAQHFTCPDSHTLLLRPAACHRCQSTCCCRRLTACSRRAWAAAGRSPGTGPPPSSPTSCSRTPRRRSRSCGTSAATTRRSLILTRVECRCGSKVQAASGRAALGSRDMGGSTSGVRGRRGRAHGGRRERATVGVGLDLDGRTARDADPGSRVMSVCDLLGVLCDDLRTNVHVWCVQRHRSGHAGAVGEPRRTHIMGARRHRRADETQDCRRYVS